MNLKNSFDNAKRKVKENLPVIAASAVAIGSAAVVMYTTNRKINFLTDMMYPGKTDFSLYLSGREMEKLRAGIPKHTGDDVFIAMRDMLKDEALERVPKTIFKD